VVFIYLYRKEKQNKLKKIILILILLIVVSFISIKTYDMYINIELESYGAAEKIVEVIKEENNTSINITETLENVTQSIVGISKIKSAGSSIFLNNSEEELGMGSGVIVSENGYIVTNWHVAGNKYSNCYVTLEDGRSYTGNVVWADSELDLAIVKINITGLKYINIGDSNTAKIGSNVYAIGNPIGYDFQRTVTAGIISGINRTVKLKENGRDVYLSNLIQTDATINPGNSGGALINSNGEMIGINTVKITSAEGIGFAIPINIIKPIIEKYKANGSFDEAYIGIFAYDKEITVYMDKNAKFDNGIYVESINLDGPSKKSGLKIGDIITKIDGNEINKMSELRSYVYSKSPNDVIQLTILRNGNESTIDVKLGKK
jgi:S1-C subfamily serine protease